MEVEFLQKSKCYSIFLGWITELKWKIKVTELSLLQYNDVTTYVQSKNHFWIFYSSEKNITEYQLLLAGIKLQ